MYACTSTGYVHLSTSVCACTDNVYVRVQVQCTMCTSTNVCTCMI